MWELFLPKIMYGFKVVIDARNKRKLPLFDGYLILVAIVDFGIFVGTGNKSGQRKQGLFLDSLTRQSFTWLLFFLPYSFP